MAALSLNRRWERWCPTFDGNDQLERPFFFEIACSLTRAEMRQLDAAISRELRANVAAATDSCERPKLDELNSDERDAAITAWKERLADAILEAEVKTFSEVLEPFVRFGSEPLTVAGQPITTLKEYLTAVGQVADQRALLEVSRAVQFANSLEGSKVVFSKRPSGGGSGTAVQKTGSKGSQTAAH